MKSQLKRISAFLPLFAVLAYSGCSQQAKIDSSLAKANAYFASDDYSSAEIEYKNVLQLDSAIPDAIGNLGIIYYEQGRFREAYLFLNRMRDIAPDNMEYRAKLASLLVNSGESENAWSEAIFILEKDPLNTLAPLVLQGAANRLDRIKEAQNLLTTINEQQETAAITVALAILQATAEDLEGAQETLQRAIALDSNFADAYLALANFQWAKQDLESAEASFKKASEVSKNTPSKRIHEARFTIRQGKVEDAEGILNEILADSPKFVPALQEKANLLLRLNRLNEAAELSEAMLQLSQYNPELIDLSVQIKLVQGDADNAIKQLKRALELFPETPIFLYKLALAQLSKEDTVKASASLMQVLAADPNHTQASLLLAGINARQGDPANAIVSLEKLLEKDPENVQAQTMMARIYIDRGDFETAFSIYEKLTSQLESNHQPPQLAAEALLRMGRNEEAQKYLELSLERNGDYLIAFERLTDLNIFEKKFDEATARLDKKLIEYPESPIPPFLKAKVLLASADSDQAEQLLNQALELGPALAPARILLARILQSQKRFEEALAQYHKLVETNPENAGAWMEIGGIHELEGEFDSAIASYEKAHELTPENGIVLNNLAFLYSEHSQENDKAYDLALKARDLLPSDPSIADTLGWIAYKRGQYDLALGLIQESMRAMPEHPEIQFHLAKTHQALGNDGEAKTAAQQALDLGLSGSNADEAKIIAE